MKLLCISTHGDEQLTLNGIYDGDISYFTIDTSNHKFQDGWNVNNEDGSFKGWYSIPHFMLLSEWREQQIEIILK